jgi:hypothetical protein
VSKLGQVVAVEVGIIMIVASFFLPGGDDLHRFYRPFAGGCLNCGFVPYFARWILYPLALIPARFVWPVWIIISVIGFIGLSRITKVNPAVVMLSFPAMGQFWLGQIDVIVLSGLVMLSASNPYLRGAGIVLALVKPQLALLPVAVLLLCQPRREIVRVLSIPIAVMIFSFLVYGLTWPLDWVKNSLTYLPAHVWRLAAQAVWPYGIGLIPVLFMIKSRRVEAALIVSALATPFFSVYSYLILLAFRSPWWSLPLSYAWLLLYPLYGVSAMRFAWILPVGLLGQLLAENRADIAAKIHQLTNRSICKISEITSTINSGRNSRRISDKTAPNTAIFPRIQRV